MSGSEYAVVLFVDEDSSPGIILTSWLESKTVCRYPPVKTNEARDKLLKKKATGLQNWPLCQVKILKTYDSFTNALLHLKKAEDTSCLSSEEDDAGKRRPKKKFILLPGEESSGESSEDETVNRKPGRRVDIPDYPVPVIQEIPQRNNGNRPSSVATSSSSKSTTSCSDCANMSNTVIQLREMVGNMYEVFARIEKKLDRILLCERNIEPSDEVFNFQLPCQNVNSFKELEEKLGDENFKNKLIKIVASVGGKNYRAFIQNMLKNLLCNELAEEFSLTGKIIKNQKKMPFQETGIFKIMSDVCKKVHEDANDCIIRESISDWLNQAKVRRMRKKVNRNATADAPDNNN